MVRSSSIDGIETDCMTLGRWILGVQKKYPDAKGDLTQLLFSITTACKTISMAVRRAGIVKMYIFYKSISLKFSFGLSGTTNTTGDSQKKLDVIANELFINNLESSQTTCALISEEDEHIMITTPQESSKYVVAFDPLDGSSNIDCLAPIGSIFCIWRKPENDLPAPEKYLQSGRKIVASGYVLYGSATVMVLAIDGHVNMFTLEPVIFMIFIL